MKRFLMILFAAVLLLLSACGGKNDPEDSAPASPAAEAPAVEAVPEALPEPTPEPTPTPEPEPVIAPETQFAAEALRDFVFDGGEAVLHRMEKPLSVFLREDTEESDRETVRQLLEQLNAVPGFPGLKLTEQEKDADITLTVCSRSEFLELAGSAIGHTEADAAYFLQTDPASGSILGAELYVRSDIEPYSRSLLLRRQLFRVVGFVYDSDLLSDRVLSEGFDAERDLSDTDRLLTELLYRSELSCGMGWADCAAALSLPDLS